ncbi:MAG: GNAT family protein [Thermodesulfovibrionales bacterium]|jgi:RimJ/RimL family protein N-acetyltransferase
MIKKEAGKGKMGATHAAQKFLAKNGEEVTLRPAAPDDATEIINTLRSASQERSYVLMEQYGKAVESEKDYINKMDHQNNLLLVAVVSGTVVGCLAAFQADEGHRQQTAHIVQIGLHLKKTYRGLGIGSEMLQYTIAWTKEHGFKKLEASIFTMNKRSLNLFLHAGFTEEGIRRKRFRLGSDYFDEVCMGRLFE